MGTLTEVASKGPEPIFATISGAQLYGFASPDSDVDLRCAFMLAADASATKTPERASAPRRSAVGRCPVPRMIGYTGPVTKSELLEFMRQHKLAVEASVSAEGGPQAAVVGIVVGEELEVFFDTLSTSRKCANLRREPRMALVLGWDLEQACTVQFEGHADEPQGAELERLKQLYFAAFPDGVERAGWPDITYVRVRPAFIRFSDFRGDAPKIVEFDRAALASLR